MRDGLGQKGHLPIVVMCVVTLAVLGEIHEIRMFEMVVRTAGLQRHTMSTAGLRVFLLEFHAFLRRYILIVIVLTVSLLFTTFLESDAFNLILNVIVLLFVFEIDNMCFKGLAYVIDVEELLSVRSSDGEKLKPITGGSTALEVVIEPKDRRGLVWGQGSFLAIGTFGMVGWTYYLACEASFIDGVAWIIDQDVAEAQSRRMISSLLTTMVFASSITVCAAHLLEALNRANTGGALGGGLRERLPIIPISIMEAYGGTFMIKETMLKIGHRRMGLNTVRTDTGHVIFYAGIVICTLLAMLATSGHMRGGYRGGRKSPDDAEAVTDAAVRVSMMPDDELMAIDSEHIAREEVSGRTKTRRKVRRRKSEADGSADMEAGDAGEGRSSPEEDALAQWTLNMMSRTPSPASRTSSPQHARGGFDL